MAVAATFRDLPVPRTYILWNLHLFFVSSIASRLYLDNSSRDGNRTRTPRTKSGDYPSSSRHPVYVVRYPGSSQSETGRLNSCRHRFTSQCPVDSISPAIPLAVAVSLFQLVKPTLSAYLTRLQAVPICGRGRSRTCGVLSSLENHLLNVRWAKHSPYSICLRHSATLPCFVSCVTIAS